MRKGRDGENGGKNINDVYSGRLERCTLVPIYTVGRAEVWKFTRSAEQKYEGGVQL